MNCGKYYWYTLCSFFICSASLNAQDMELFTESVDDFFLYETNDTIDVSIDKEQDKIFDIRYQLEKQNKEYYKPSPPTAEMRRAMRNNSTQLSEEALYWSRKRMDPADYFGRSVTFKDTILYNPFLLPPIFKRKYIEKEFKLYDPGEKLFTQPYITYTAPAHANFFEQEKRKIEQNQEIYRHVALHNPRYFKYIEEDLPDEIIQVQVIKKTAKEVPLIIRPERSVVEIAPPAKFIPDRMYWTSQFESAVQFSQNYVSPNWHKGGSSNLNLYTKNHLRYNYNRDKIQFTNELEDKISLYNAAKDTLHRFKIGEDVFRVHSNFGYQAFNKWYYTLDGEFRTQFLHSYEENEDKLLAAFLAPFSVNIGIGMKYDLNKEFRQKGKNLQLAVNMAPVSYSFMYSRNRDIDLGRHGFQKNEETDEFERSLSQLGSTIRADFTMNFNPNISWQSRFYYFTTYEKIIAEFENTLVLAITRHFSTRIYFHLRFDDSVEKTEDFNSYFQINELLSFGFNYKW